MFGLLYDLVPLRITKVVLFEGKEGNLTVAVGHSGLHGGHEGGPLDNLEDNVHDSRVVFSITQVVVGGPLDLLVMEGQVLGDVGQQQRSILEWGVSNGQEGHITLDNVGKGDLAYSKDSAGVVLEELDHLHDGYGLTQEQ